MNDNNLNNNNLNDNKVNTYRATSNLNTAIENPQINVNSATGVNIKDSGYNNYAENNINNNSNFLNNNFNQSNNNINSSNNVISSSNNDISSKYVPTNNDNNHNSYSNQSTENYSYQPVMKEKKENGTLSNTIHSKEFKIMIFIVFILVLFLLLMPYIYDFFRELSMSMTA